MFSFTTFLGMPVFVASNFGLGFWFGILWSLYGAFGWIAVVILGLVRFASFDHYWCRVWTITAISAGVLWLIAMIDRHQTSEDEIETHPHKHQMH